MAIPDRHGRFGPYGGRYVPETLMPALLELEEAYKRTRKDPRFQAELKHYLKEYVGRPTPLYFAQRLTKRLGGAKALGLDHEIGSIAAGKSADLCAIALDDPMLAPCYSPASHMVYVAGRENVSHVWVAGQLLLENHTLTGFLKKDLEKIASIWQTRISPRARLA